MDIKITNKNEMIEYLKNGIGADMFERFGVFSVHLYPFKDTYTEEEKNILADKSEKITIDKDTLESLTRSNISTVFNGTRFYFHKYEDLEKFCEIVEN